jgi:hypothetical protein
MRQNILRNENGMVLLTVMGFVAVLFIAGIAANHNVNSDISGVVKHMSGTKSLYIAEAGIARAKAECVSRYTAGNWGNFTALLKGVDSVDGTSDDGILSFGNSVSFHGGTYAVKVMNDTKDNGGAYVDTNNTLVIESAGTYLDSVTKLRVVIRMNKVPAINGSITLLGEADALFTGTSFLADGRDYRLSDGTTPTGTDVSKYAITTFDGSSRTGVVDSLADNQKNRVLGLGYDASTSPVTPSVGTSSGFTGEDVKSYTNSVKYYADNQLNNPSTLDGVNLGTIGSPKVTYILKTDSTSIKVTANTSGAGLLVIEGGDLEITLTGNMSWVGMIVVLGRSVGFKQTGSGSLKGGLIVYEDNNPDIGKEIELGGNFEIKYSSEAVSLVNSMVSGKQKYTIVSWQKVS